MTVVSTPYMIIFYLNPYLGVRPPYKIERLFFFIYINNLKHNIMQIFIKTIRHKTIVLDSEPSDLIGDIKQKILDKEGIPANLWYFVFQCKPLTDERSLLDYNIQRENTLHVVVRVKHNNPAQ